jgi:hypothetical protein
MTQSLARGVFPRNAALSSQALRVNKRTETMKPCSQSSKNQRNNSSSMPKRIETLPV